MGKKDTERRIYPPEFNAEAIVLAEKREKPVSQIAEVRRDPRKALSR
jgi:transposase-like protein